MARRRTVTCEATARGGPPDSAILPVLSEGMTVGELLHEFQKRTKRFDTARLYIHDPTKGYLSLSRQDFVVDVTRENDDIEAFPEGVIPPDKRARRPADGEVAAASGLVSSRPALPVTEHPASRKPSEEEVEAKRRAAYEKFNMPLPKQSVVTHPAKGGRAVQAFPTHASAACAVSIYSSVSPESGSSGEASEAGEDRGGREHARSAVGDAERRGDRSSGQRRLPQQGIDCPPPPVSFRQKPQPGSRARSEARKRMTSPVEEAASTEHAAAAKKARLAPRHLPRGSHRRRPPPASQPSPAAAPGDAGCPDSASVGDTGDIGGAGRARKLARSVGGARLPGDRSGALRQPPQHRIELREAQQRSPAAAKAPAVKVGARKRRSHTDEVAAARENVGAAKTAGARKRRGRAEEEAAATDLAAAPRKVFVAGDAPSRRPLVAGGADTRAVVLKPPRAPSAASARRSVEEHPLVLAASRCQAALVDEWREASKPRKRPSPPPMPTLPSGGDVAFDMFVRQLRRWLFGRKLMKVLVREPEGDRVAEFPNSPRITGLYYRLVKDALVEPGLPVEKGGTWDVAFHGTWWYALWSILHFGVLLESESKDQGHDFWSPGVYCTPRFDTACWYARAHNVFGDNLYHRAVLEVRYDRMRLRTSRVKGGHQLVLPWNGVSITGVLFCANAPPCKGEERFDAWDCGLEAIPDDAGTGRPPGPAATIPATEECLVVYRGAW